jgi:hypothetical protein
VNHCLAQDLVREVVRGVENVNLHKIREADLRLDRQHLQKATQKKEKSQRDVVITMKRDFVCRETYVLTITEAIP